MKYAKTSAIAAFTMAVVGGGIAFTLQEASAAASPAVAKVVGSKLVVTSGNGTVNDVTLYPSINGGFMYGDSGAILKIDPASAAGCLYAGTQLPGGGSHYLACTSVVSTVQVTLADGNDSFDNQSARATTVNAGDGDDTILGGSNADVINGAAGKDVIKGGFGNDTIQGGAGEDTIFGQAGDDKLTDVDMADALWGSSGNDVLIGGRTTHGDDGNDILYPLVGGEHWGGTEYDIIDFSKWTVLVHVSLDGNQNDGDADADPTDTSCGGILGGCIPDPMNVHGDFEKMIGTAFDDVIIGNGNNNEIDAGEGKDAIDGRGGDDYLDVEGGNNQRVRGGGGEDTCVGYNITTRENCEH
jgi:Ca2+-binding RTX toxin-like protein